MSGIFNDLNDTAADDRGVGEGSDFGELLGGGDAESYRDRKLRELLDAADETAGVGASASRVPVTPVRETA